MSIEQEHETRQPLFQNRPLACLSQQCLPCLDRAVADSVSQLGSRTVSVVKVAAEGVLLIFYF